MYFASVDVKETFNLEMSMAWGDRGAGCFSPNAHDVYIDMLISQVLVRELIHIELLNQVKKGIRVTTHIASYRRYNFIMMSDNTVWAHR